MNILILWIIMFLDIIYYLVIFDVILSWVALTGLRFRPKIISDILRPVYTFVKKMIPTTFGWLDFTPIVIILLIAFLKGALLVAFPESAAYINSFIQR